MTKLYKFYSDTCAPCKNFAPVLEKVLKDYPSIELEVVNVGTEVGLDLAREKGIRGNLPIVSIDFKINHSGQMSEQQFRNWLDSNIS